MRNRHRAVAVTVASALGIALLMPGINPAQAASKKKTTKKPPTTQAPTTVAATAAPTTAAAAATTAAPTSAPAPAGDAALSLTGFDVGTKTIKIGFSGILTGAFQFLGNAQRNSLQVEIDRINAAGGVGGAKLELVVRDDALSAAKANDIAREFANDKSVGLVVGPAITGNFNAVRGVYEDAKKVNCQPAVAGDAGFGTTLHYAFRAQDNGSDVVPFELKFLKEQGVGIVALIYTNNATGKQFDKDIPAAADKLGLVWAGTSFTQPSDQTHAPQVKEAMDTFAQRKQLKPAIWIDNDANAAKTVAAAKAAGFKGIFVGGSGLGNYAIVDAGGAGMDDATFEAPYQGALTRIPADQQPAGYARHTQEVIKRFGFEKGTKEPVQQYLGTAIAADCIVMYATAVAKAKSIDADKVVDAWETLKFPFGFLPSGVPASFSKTDHETYQISDLWMWKWKKDDKGWYVELARKSDSSK